jgi:hypothetical protein
MGHHAKIPLLCYGLLILPDDRPWFLFSTHLNDKTVEALKASASPVSTLAKRLQRSFKRKNVEVDYVLRLEASSEFGRVHVHGVLRALNGKTQRDRRFIRERLNVAMGEWQTPSSAIYQSHVPRPVSLTRWVRYISKEPAISRLELRMKGIHATKLYAASNKVRSYSHSLWGEVHAFANHEHMEKAA